MSQVQALISPLISYGTTLVCDFVSDFVEDGGSPAGSNPTAGNSLVVWLDGSQTCTGLVARNSSGTTIGTFTEVYAPASGTTESCWLLTDIAAGIVDIQATFSSGGNCTFACIEDDQDLTAEYEGDWGNSPEGWSATHSHAYTAATDDELAFAYANNVRLTTALYLGTNRLIVTDGDFARAYWKDITASGAGQIDVELASSANHPAAVATFSRAGGAANITASLAEDGDSTVADLQVVNDIAASLSELGDSNTSALQVINAVTASLAELGDSVTATIQAPVAVSASLAEEGDVTAAAMQLIVQLAASLAEDGDATVSSVVGAGTITLTSSQTEAGDATKARILPPDYSEAFFTVDYAGLNANSPFYQDTDYSNLAIGDSFVHETETPEDGHTVSMTGDGVVSLSPASLPQDQTIDFYIWDASDETLGTQGTITVEAARSLTINQVELGDTQAATLTGPPPVNISSSQTELGDSVVVNFQVLNQLLAAQTELGDQGVAAIDATQEAFITAAQVEDEEQTSATLQNLVNLGATQSEEGDGTVAAIEVIVVTNLTVSLVEDGDTVSASVSPLVSISVGQVELGDAQIGSVAGPVRGGVFNLYGQFPSGSSVTITLYDPVTGATVPLDSSTCSELGTTGSYVWGTEQITTQPEGYQEYVWEMTDGLTTQDGLYKMNEAALIAAAVNALTLAEWIALR